MRRHARFVPPRRGAACDARGPSVRDRRHEQVGCPAAAAVYGVRSAEARWRPIARVVVQEPARTFLRAGFSGTLEVLSLQREREPIAYRKRGARRPDLEIDLDDLAGFQLLRFIV